MSTLVDKIVQTMRADIFSGNLRAGQPLKQVELANRYGVSPIPLREALQRLQVEGLVEYFAYRGAIVARTRKAEATDIVDIRKALELLAFEHALPHLVQSQLVELERLTEALDSPRSRSDANYFMESNLAYFETLLARSNRPILLEMIQMNLKRATRYYAELLRQRPDEADLKPSRRDYLAAIHRRDLPALRVMIESRHTAFLSALESVLED
ncbi:GntR family transcriptional regulator [Chitinimonas sp.]|uniref:GntR family transcriptional regulator n=1 Tax=Chitinimonas sp. TaxID=1934313 RepID=UPI0035B0D753